MGKDGWRRRRDLGTGKPPQMRGSNANEVDNVLLLEIYVRLMDTSYEALQCHQNNPELARRGPDPRKMMPWLLGFAEDITATASWYFMAPERDVSPHRTIEDLQGFGVWQICMDYTENTPVPWEPG